MAKKIMGYIKLQLPAGKATPQPPVGPALGQYGVSIPNFTKDPFWVARGLLSYPKCQLQPHHVSMEGLGGKVRVGR